jgi:ribonucleoside-diphosphate reductase alpha chain
MEQKKQRPKQLSGHTYQITTGCGKIYITINEHDGKPFEIFATIGKAGGCACAQTEAIGRLVSLGLQRGIVSSHFIKSLSGICCHSALIADGDKIMSCADAVAKVLKEHMDIKTELADKT